MAGDTNGFFDVFVHDRTTGQTTRISVDSTGAEANGFSFSAPISADGRIVTFQSDASNLVAGDTNGFRDIFVHDRMTGVTTRVSVDSVGAQSNGSCFVPWISADGQIVAFDGVASNLVAGDTNGWRDIFVHDRVTGETTRVSVDSVGTEGDDGSLDASLSADGRFVAFESRATNLVAGDTNAVDDIFVHDRGPPAECFLVIGDGPGGTTFVEIDHVFKTQVGPTVEDSYPVLLTDIPEFVLPTPAATARRRVAGSGGLGSTGSGLGKGWPTAGPSPAWMLDGSVRRAGGHVEPRGLSRSARAVHRGALRHGATRRRGTHRTLRNERGRPADLARSRHQRRRPDGHPLPVLDPWPVAAGGCLRARPFLGRLPVTCHTPLDYHRRSIGIDRGVPWIGTTNRWTGVLVQALWP